MALEFWVFRFLGSVACVAVWLLVFLEAAWVYDTVSVGGAWWVGGCAKFVGFFINCSGGIIHWHNASAYESSLVLMGWISVQ